MNRITAIKTAIETVPQWYICDIGPNIFELSIDDASIKFCAHKRFTPQIQKVFEFINENLKNWANQLPELPTLSSLSKIKEEIALNWLKNHDASVNWNKVLAYLDNLRYRTAENQPVAINLIIKPDEGRQDLTSEELQKIIDCLAASTHVCFVVDKELRYIDYIEIRYDEIKKVNDYKYNPEFLHPFLSKLEAGEFSVHLTNRGDIVIQDSMGMLASFRKGKWFVYDVQTFKNTMVEILNEYRVGCNIFELVFDLSYKRHGALLVFDPNHKVINNVINTESIIYGANIKPDSPRKMLADSITNIKMGAAGYYDRKKRIMIELASLDGAVIFDKNNILAFGAMVNLHPESKGYTGARSTAAHSAYKWGGRPIKISSDGEITLLFDSTLNGYSEEAKVSFL